MAYEIDDVEMCSEMLQDSAISENTDRLQLLHAEFEKLHKNLKTIDNLWEEVTKEGDMKLVKVKGEPVSFKGKLNFLLFDLMAFVEN